MEAIQPYMRMDEIAFQARLTDLKEQRRRGDPLAPEAEFLVNHPGDMEKLRELLLKKERMLAESIGTLADPCESPAGSLS